jgi:D-erythro-7,8-dihydroneopterin triphosphate epimerase
MRDHIDVQELVVKALIGVREEERRAKQELRIHLRLFIDTRRAGATDRIEDTTDYDAVAQRVVRVAEESHFQLLERLAEEVARVCVKDFAVPRVQVRIEKPGALRMAKSVSISIERDASDYLR